MRLERDPISIGDREKDIGGVPVHSVSAEPLAKWPAVDRGSGRTVVFLHGYPLSHAIWGPQLATLSERNRVVLFDLPGYGLARDEPVPGTLAGFADSVHASLFRRFSSPVVVVGHSFGGYVALEWFHRHPEAFAALVLSNSRSQPDDPVAREKRLATVKRLENPGELLDADETTRSLLASQTWTAAGPVVDTVRTIVRGVPIPTVISTLKAIAGRPDLTPVLPTIDIPALVIWGEEDRLIPPAQSRSMVPQLRGSVGAGIDGAGHLPSLEAPGLFTPVLSDFLRRLPAT